MQQRMKRGTFPAPRVKHRGWSSCWETGSQCPGAVRAPWRRRWTWSCLSSEQTRGCLWAWSPCSGGGPRRCSFPCSPTWLPRLWPVTPCRSFYRKKPVLRTRGEATFLQKALTPSCFCTTTTCPPRKMGKQEELNGSGKLIYYTLCSKEKKNKCNLGGFCGR